MTIKTIASDDCRPLAMAGQFYPADTRSLEAAMMACSNQARRPWARPYKAMIVPHAGLAFSGPVASTAFASIASHASKIEKVVILGPSHHVQFSGAALSSASAFETPFGPLHVATDSILVALCQPGVTMRDSVFDHEHSIEMILIHLAKVAPQASIVPILVGDMKEEDLDRLFNALWGGPETLILISSDLSHYHDAAMAHKMDLETAAHIERLEDKPIDSARACGHLPLSALLRKSRLEAMRPVRLDVRHSGDMTGKSDKVVGYGAFGFEPVKTAKFPGPLVKELLSVAKSSIEIGYRKKEPANLDMKTFHQPLHGMMASFVTIEKRGNLRGCMGSYTPKRPLVQDVMYNAYLAAFEDKRFTPLALEELAEIDISLSLLSLPFAFPIKTLGEARDILQPDIDGLIVKKGPQHALFLPKVWKQLPDADLFLQRLFEKAGIAMPELDAPLSGDLKLWRFYAEYIEHPA